MLTVSINLAIQFQFAQSPVDKPHVVKADAVSNSAFIRLMSGSTTVTKKHEMRMNVADIRMIVVAFSTKDVDIA